MRRATLPFRLLTVLVLAAAVLSTHAAAQTWTARHIVFENAGPFTQAQLESASGMHIGQPVTAATMQTAAQKLVDSGYFDDVGVVLDGTAANTSVVFTLKPLTVEDMLPLGFENLIWLSPAEIQQAIVARFPLYIGRLSETSPQADLVAQALTDALTAKGVAGAEVFHQNIEPTLQHPVRAMEFRVTRPAVRVANVKLAGVVPDLVPLIQKAVNASVRSAFNDGLNGVLTRDVLLAPLLDAGYITAALDNFAPQVQPLTADNVEPVIVAAALHSGEIYHLSSITFAGTPVFSAESFAAAVKLKPGDVAARRLLLQSLLPIDAAYRKLGFLDVIVTAAPAIDEAARTVAYTVSVAPGEPYRMHDVTTQNLSERQIAAFNKAFLLHAGDTYNASYVVEFLKNNTAIHELLGCTGAYKTIAMPSTHTVDLVLTFSCPVDVKG